MNNIFDHLAVLKIPNIDKKAVSKKVIADAETGLLYWAELVLSVLIATFGLLQNSAAVIIGAMIIAPLLRPIQATSFAIASSHSAFLGTSIRLMIRSILVGVGVAWLAAYLIPIKIETTEILSRTAPNLLDLFIAIASGAIAFLALKYTRLSSSVAGVAMASALVPPLAVVGIELSFLNFTEAWGAMLLFITNIFAILMVGVGMFFAFGFSPHQLHDQEKTLRNTGVLLIIMIFLTIPLATSLLRISDRIALQNKATEHINANISLQIPGATLRDITLGEMTDDAVQVRGTMSVPEEIPFFVEFQERLVESLQQTLERKVDLELEIIRTAKMVSASDEVSVDQQIRAMITEKFLTMLPESTLISTLVEPSAVSDSLLAKIEYAAAGDKKSTEDARKMLEETVKNAYSPQEISFFWLEVQPLAVTSAEKKAEEALRKKMELEWENFLYWHQPLGVEIADSRVTWRATDEADMPLELVQCDPLPEFLTCEEGDENPKIKHNPNKKTIKSYTLSERVSEYLITFDAYASEVGQENLPIFEAAIDGFQSQFEKNIRVRMRVIPYEIRGD